MADRKSAPTVDARTALEQFQDYLAPRLDVYEQAVYLYILRHSRLVGKPRLTVEVKSARHKIARGLGRTGSRITSDTFLEKLRSLDSKGCVKLAEGQDDAPDVRVLLPSEMPGLMEKGRRKAEPDLEKMDFLNVAANRRMILEREEGRCFYCLRRLTDSSTTVVHVASRPAGDDGYRNVVAACRRCATRKGESSAEDLLRVLYREAAVTADVLADRLEALKQLREGKLRP
jgi:hypothetical protein